ncbi:MAG: YbaB/EbfC family nucleoid-associated protein [Firmicutes bacterium]|nr:YbaB/EbfC family nucleoid-associated protein [Bacillota bacterium]
MNIQAMMKQAQKLQKDMLNAKEEIDNTDFEVTKSFVSVKAKGNRKIQSIKIDMESLEKDDIEMLEDLLQVAITELMDTIDKETEKKMGKYTQGMPGLF